LTDAMNLSTLVVYWNDMGKLGKAASCLLRGISRYFEDEKRPTA
jgi:hypothetical protein